MWRTAAALRRAAPSASSRQARAGSARVWARREGGGRQQGLANTMASEAVNMIVDSRNSVREFTQEQVPLETVLSLVERAARAPSGGNTQPWHVYVVVGEAKAELTEAVMAEMGKGNMGDEPEYSMYPPSKASAAFMERRRRLGYAMYELMGIARDDKVGRMLAMQRNFDFFGAPVGLMITVDRFCDRNAWGHVGMFLQTLALLAQAEGLSTCFQEAWATYHSVVYKHLGIGESEILWCGVALGHADKSAKVNELRSEREPLASFVKVLGADAKL